MTTAPTTNDGHDVLVIGGGPAGAALALLLARRGVSVALVDDGRGPRSGPTETLLASSRPLLERIGLAAPVAAAAAPDHLRHGAVWGSCELVWRDAEAWSGLVLRRGAFEPGLRSAAAAEGVMVHAGRARRHADGRWWLRSAAGAERSLAARCVVDAAGRRTAHGHAARTPIASGPATRAFTFLAIAAEGDRGTAVVEAVPNGWIWTHAATDGSASAAVLLDAQDATADRRHGALDAAFAAAAGPACRLGRRSLRHATDATPRLFAACDDVLTIGDAAATVDPLASQGVEKALAAAEHAAVVVATALAHPAWQNRLWRLHAQWEAGLFRAHAAAAAAHYREEPRFAAAPFWRQRQQPADAVSDGDPAVPLTVHAQVAPARVLVRRGDTIVELDGAEHAGSGEALASLGHVPVQPLLRCFSSPSSLAAATRQAGADPRLFVLAPAAVHGALLELRRRGWLTPATNAADSP